MQHRSTVGLILGLQLFAVGILTPEPQEMLVFVFQAETWNDYLSGFSLFSCSFLRVCLSLHIQEVSPTDSGKRAVVISLFITFITFFCSFNLYLIRPGKKANLLEDLFNSIDAGSDMKVKKKRKRKRKGTYCLCRRHTYSCLVVSINFFALIFPGNHTASTICFTFRLKKREAHWMEIKVSLLIGCILMRGTRF